MMKYSILINTCDKFEDCWNPFFKLFSTYWPDYNGKIYLNTEYKDYSHDGLNIVPVKGCEIRQDRGQVTWSECLIRALEVIESDVVLYMQEDYFLKDYVKDDIVSGFVDLMRENAAVDCIHLTDQAVLSSGISSGFEHLEIAAQKQRYRICCQAALWRKDVLLTYLRSYENAWQFEEFGSKRAEILKHNFYVVDRSWVRLNSFEIIPYVFTGIVRGRWIDEVVPLFEKHDIDMEFSKRGFFKNAPRKPLLEKIKYQIDRIPTLYKHLWDLRKVRKQSKNSL